MELTNKILINNEKEAQNFKKQVRYIYNQYADSELTEQYQKLKKE